MYTNIDTDYGFQVMEEWLNRLVQEKNINNSFPIDLINSALEIVMTNNYFKFGNTYWVQLLGTAMGTPVTCVYATIYFALKETYSLIPKFKKEISCCVRYIDDVAGVQ